MNLSEPLTHSSNEIKAIIGTVVTGGTASIPWLVDVDLWFRILASGVAIGVGVITGIYYWKKIRNLNKLNKE